MEGLLTVYKLKLNLRHIIGGIRGACIILFTIRSSCIGDL